jgi:hypothetical protein
MPSLSRSAGVRQASSGEAVYGRYLSERLHGARVEFARLTRFRLEKMIRPHRGASAPATGMAERTHAVFEGVVMVIDPKALMASSHPVPGRDHGRTTAPPSVSGQDGFDEHSPHRDARYASGKLPALTHGKRR